MKAPLKRGAGILLPISSLPSPYGIGTLGKDAREFIDRLHRAGQTYWQVLPVGPTSYGDSPYQSFSAFAGNPYFIDLDTLARDGLLTARELAAIPAGRPDRVDYGWLFETRFPLLRRAFGRFADRNGAFAAYCDAQRDWLDDYAFYMALKERFGHREWLQWDEDIRLRRPDAVDAWRRELAENIRFWQFCQFLFDGQWAALKTYANRAGIAIIGDIPIYAALDSADVWAAPGQFQLDETGRPTHVAGVPPDAFSATGQRWGNPLYDWAAMERDGFAWWRRRVARCARLYDVIRIDHFIGIARYYAIPAASETALMGEWREGPGKRLTDAIDQAAGDARILAEDLGVLHESVRRLLQATGYPGMKVLLFAFDSGAGNTHLPHWFDHNAAVYGGTHDNETIAGYCAGKTDEELRYLMDYLQAGRREDIPRALLRAAYQSVADAAIFQMQDILELDDTARMNTPSTIGGNWLWRLSPGQFTDELARELRRLAELYGRA